MAAAAAGKYDLVLMDCQMPGMDDFLGKPLDLERLQATLARWIKPR